MRLLTLRMSEGWSAYVSSQKPRIARLLSLGCLLLLGQFGQAQVVINEIFPNGTVELKNITDSTVNVANYWLCDFPDYQRISNSNLACGTTNLPAGAILTVDDFMTIDPADGEMGLYINGSFNQASSIIDYVEWGSTGHGRASVATAAGIWTNGDFAPAFSMGESLEYDGMGDASTDWGATDSPTVCNENSNAPVCDVEGGSIELEIGGTSTSICVDGIGDPLGVTVSGSSGPIGQWIITDDANTILVPSANPPFDFDGAGTGTCLIWYIRYESGLMGNMMGNNLSDLTGCFDLSNPVTVIREEADGGTVSLEGGGNSASICVDGIADPLTIEHQTDAPNLTYNYVITDDVNTILAISTSNIIDLDGAGTGVCRVWGWSYRGLNANDFLNRPLQDLQDADCSDISEDFVEVIREAADGGTVN
ncbi:MAG: hypothetical protein AAFR05_12765, partial [Bacteroidota bacterium]